MSSSASIPPPHVGGSATDDGSTIVWRGVRLRGDASQFGIAGRFAVEGIRTGVSRVRRPDAGAVAGPNIGPDRGQNLAVVTSVTGRVPAGSPVGSRTAELVQAPGQSAGGVLGVTVLPGADVAAAD